MVNDIMQGHSLPKPRYRVQKSMSTWFVYILRCADNTFYCGITTDIERRLKQHNAGSASKYTRTRTPVQVETYVEAGNKSDALKLEIQVKKQHRGAKARFLESHGKPTG